MQANVKHWRPDDKTERNKCQTRGHDGGEGMKHEIPNFDKFIAAEHPFSLYIYLIFRVAIGDP